VVSTYRSLALSALVAIGGDGTMSIAHGLTEVGLNVVGVPKTIDNDLAGTDRSFGFDTAVSIAAEGIDRIHTTAQSHHRVMIVETMGRYSGWIALHAGVASGTDVILLPEIEYEVENVADVCRDRERSGQRFTIIAVAEGARGKERDYVVQERGEEYTDSIRLGGISRVLADQLREHLDTSIRTTVLGHMQRGGTPTAYDRNLATIYGSRAAALVADRTYGVLANGVIVGAITVVPFINKGSARRPVEQPFWAAVGMFGVTLAFTLSMLSVKNLMPMDVHLLFDLTFLAPPIVAAITYAVLKTMREGYMYDLNRRYYRLRPPK